ncbi:hypothetical protein [Sphingobium cloacae]|uniref:hypothetical protein n=1 Tax=Sphingobium cloacae TaxID=120107 RepID=UPI00083260F9|nr:hypothetical protein [Sphingobium cloacae]
MTAPSAQAERFARARQEFAEAMQRGCTIPELRKRKAEERAALRQRAQDAVSAINGRQGFVVIDEAADFGRWDAHWMMRD